MSENQNTTKNGVVTLVAFFCFVVAFGVSTFELLGDISHAFWVWSLSMFGFAALSVVCFIENRWRIVFVCLAIATVICVDLRFSYRVQIWNHRDEKGTWYRDSYRRFGNQFHRELHTDNYTSEGPTADSGSAHGMWKTTYFKKLDSRRDWYWYGERTTEAEWHRRNKTND